MQRTQLRMMKHLCAYDSSSVSSFVKTRPGETKVGQGLVFLPTQQANDITSTGISQQLAEAVGEGARYAIIGVPEDIGPRANKGRGVRYI
jgi:formiminoglutamase